MTDLERLEAELTGGVETTVQPPTPELKESIDSANLNKIMSILKSRVDGYNPQS